MAAFGAATSRVRLGQMCTCMAYRNPAYLAKVAATVDVISGGRIEMGIGAGWYEHEWRAYGYGFPKAGDRLGALREGVQVFRDMWTKGSATLDGKYYQVDGAICAPRPLQGTSHPGSALNGIPMWIAGGGEKVTLKIAAQYADYTNFFDGRHEGFDHKSAILRGPLRRPRPRLRRRSSRSANFNVVIGETEDDVEDRLAVLRRACCARAASPTTRPPPPSTTCASQPAVGTPEQVIEVDAQGHGRRAA